MCHLWLLPKERDFKRIVLYVFHRFYFVSNTFTSIDITEIIAQTLSVLGSFNVMWLTIDRKLIDLDATLGNYELRSYGGDQYDRQGT